MDAAVARTAEEAVAGLGEGARAALPALITAIVRDVTIDPDGGLGALTLVPVARTDFERGDAARRALIDEFVARRLLTTEEVDGSIRVRPVHEALLRVVPAAVAVIKENAALIRVRHTLDPMVAEWTRAPADKKPDFLVTSPALIAGAAQLDERFGADLPAGMRGFIAESLAADARRREAERSRQRRILMATAAGLIIAVVLAGLAGWQWRVAAEQRLIADQQRTRAQTALTAATKTTETLIFDLAQEFRRRTGMPVDLTRLILERVQELQRQLAAAGERTPELLNLEAAALDELAALFLDQGDPKAALAAAERARDILQGLVEAIPTLPTLKRELAVAWNKIGDAKFAMADTPGALTAFQTALTIVTAIASAEPERTGFQRDLTICLNKVADALAILGRRDEALANYRRSIAISEALAARASRRTWCGSRIWRSRTSASATCSPQPGSARRRSKPTRRR
jgi:hypothetical protein